MNNCSDEVMQHRIESFCKVNELCLIDINFSEKYFTIITALNGYENLNFSEIYA